MDDKKKLDIACGSNKREGFIGIDIADLPGVDIVHDLNVYPWPIDSESVDEIHCSHYVEHIKHSDTLTEIKQMLETSKDFNEFKKAFLASDRPRDGFIKFMEEVDRILKPGGEVEIIAPYVTHTRAFGDPTHERYIHDWSFYYFNKEWRDTNKLSHYGITCDFDVRYSYLIDESLILKSDEVRNEAFKKDWNSITDLIVNLTKR